MDDQSNSRLIRWLKAHPLLTQAVLYLLAAAGFLLFGIKCFVSFERHGTWGLIPFVGLLSITAFLAVGKRRRYIKLAQQVRQDAN